jgi:hypothetical protein
MTTTHTVPAISPAAIEDEGSVVAITLSWPSAPGNIAIGQQPGRTRACTSSN